MRDYRIVEATEKEFGIIQRIAHATWPSTFGDILSPEQIDYMLNRMYATEALREQVAAGHVYHLLLAPTAAGDATYAPRSGQRYEPVGYISHQFEYLPRTTKIHKLYVLPDHQGKGYGKLLIEKVGKLAIRAGQQALRLDVNYRNPAISFYEGLGFDKIERCNTDIGNGYLMEDWVMIKLLN